MDGENGHTVTQLMGGLPLMRRVLLPVLVAASVLGPPEALADGSTRVSAAAAAADQAALLRFEAGGDDPAGTLQGWGRAPGSSGEPCTTASWNVRDSGWHGVMCDGAQGRVTHLSLPHGRLRGDIAELALLTALRHLSLGSNREVHGDIAQLAGLVQLRSLNLAHTSVHGNVASLSRLPYLGEGWRGPDGNGGRGGLWLADTLVSGPVASLRSLSGFHDWGRSSTKHFTSCTDFDTAQHCRAHRGLSPVEDPSAVAGQDACACCDAGQPVRLPCIAWRQTASCDPSSEDPLSWRNPERDLLCNETVPSGAAGFCECAGGVRRKLVGCNGAHTPSESESSID